MSLLEGHHQIILALDGFLRRRSPTLLGFGAKQRGSIGLCRDRLGLPQNERLPEFGEMRQKIIGLDLGAEIVGAVERCPL